MDDAVYLQNPIVGRFVVYNYFINGTLVWYSIRTEFGNWFFVSGVILRCSHPLLK